MSLDSRDMLQPATQEQLWAQRHDLSQYLGTCDCDRSVVAEYFGEHTILATRTRRRVLGRTGLRNACSYRLRRCRGSGKAQMLNNVNPQPANPKLILLTISECISICYRYYYVRIYIYRVYIHGFQCVYCCYCYHCCY